VLTDQISKNGQEVLKVKKLNPGRILRYMLGNINIALAENFRTLVVRTQKINMWTIYKVFIFLENR
jgi:hypothetical protein